MLAEVRMYIPRKKNYVSHHLFKEMKNNYCPSFAEIIAECNEKKVVKYNGKTLHIFSFDPSHLFVKIYLLPNLKSNLNLQIPCKSDQNWK
jgi:hypothetical protein